MNPAVSSSDYDEDYYRREANGAFAHEVRTPLTAIRMVLELGKRADGQLTLDAELADMLRKSIDDLEELADHLQESSRLERGKLQLSTGPCGLRNAVDAAREEANAQLELLAPVPAITGPWDEGRLVSALVDFVEAAARAGVGHAQLKVEAAADHVGIVISSGQPGRTPKALAADVGYGLFRGRQVVLAMGGEFAWERAERYLEVRLTLPRQR